MFKGGYKIIDLKDKGLVNASYATISGIYESIESNYRKPLVLSGITLDGVEYNDTGVTVTISNGNYVIVVYGYTLTIDKDDKVTVAKN